MHIGIWVQWLLPCSDPCQTNISSKCCIVKWNQQLIQKALVLLKLYSYSLTSSLLELLWQGPNRAPTGNPGESWAPSARYGWCIPINVRCGWRSPFNWFNYLSRGWGSRSGRLNCCCGRTMVLGHWAAATVANFWSLYLSISVCFIRISVTSQPTQGTKYTVFVVGWEGWLAQALCTEQWYYFVWYIWRIST